MQSFFPHLQVTQGTTCTLLEHRNYQIEDGSV